MATSLSVELFQPLRMWLIINLLMLGIFITAAFGIWHLASVETQRLTDVQWDTLVRARVKELESGNFRDFVEGSGAEFNNLYFDIKSQGRHFTVGQLPKSRRCTAKLLENGAFSLPLTFTLCRPFQFPALSLAGIIGIYLLGTGLSLILIIRTERSARSMLVDFIESHGVKIDRSLGLIAFLRRIGEITAELDDARRKQTDFAKAEAVGQIARQVAHDIRSPLAALDSMIQRLGPMPEDQRTIIRGAVTRISDIAHHLLDVKGPRPLTGARLAASMPGGVTPTVSPRPALSLVDSLLSEKRIELQRYPNLDLGRRLDQAGYGLFVKVDPSEFKRALSNIINNAAEATNFIGHIAVSVLTRDRDVVIRVADHGTGISTENLKQLAEPGRTFGKTEGQHQGLGLFHARQMAERAGGTLRIDSQQGAGTIVDIVLPKSRPPKWFLPALDLNRCSVVAVLDDDESIHDVWRLRFSSLADRPQVLHFHCPADFQSWYESFAMKSDVVLLTDYELIGSAVTGVDVCRTVSSAARTILVTSHDEDAEIQAACVTLGVSLLPKSQASLVPLCVESVGAMVQASLSSSATGVT